MTPSKIEWNPDEDQQTIRQLRAKDEAGLVRLLRHHGSRAKGYLAAQYAPDVVDAAIFEAAWKAWRYFGTFDEERGDLGGWFFKIAMRSAADIARKEKAWARSHHRETTFVEPESRPDSPVTLAEPFELPTEVVAQLSRLQRKIIEADVRNGSPVHATILANEFGSTANSIRAQRAKAVKALRAMLGPGM